MSNQIIGNYKEFIVINRSELKKIEESVINKLEKNKDRPMSESSIEARAVLDLIGWIKENNIYNHDFKIKS